MGIWTNLNIFRISLFIKHTACTPLVRQRKSMSRSFVKASIGESWVTQLLLNYAIT